VDNVPQWNIWTHLFGFCYFVYMLWHAPSAGTLVPFPLVLCCRSLTVAVVRSRRARRELHVRGSPCGVRHVGCMCSVHAFEVPLHVGVGCACAGPSTHTHTTHISSSPSSTVFHTFNCMSEEWDARLYRLDLLGILGLLLASFSNGLFYGFYCHAWTAGESVVLCFGLRENTRSYVWF